jgi:parallel beta-helix repeat protein
VEILFVGNYWLKVDGQILAQGTVQAPIVFAAENPGTPWHHLKIVSSIEESVLNHVHIRHAGASNTSASQAYGALYLVDAAPSIEHVVIENNGVTGIFAENMQRDLRIANSTIRNNINAALNGIGAGAIFVEGLSTNNVFIENNEIISNRSDSHGGAINIVNPSTVEIVANIIQYNQAQSSFGHGGAIYVTGIAGTMVQNRIVGNTISGNVAHRDGGGIWLDESALTIENNIIKDNHAENAQGGGIYIGDTDTQDTLTALTSINGNVFIANVAAETGGGVFVENGSHTFAGNVLLANAAYDASGGITRTHGGGLFIQDGTISAANNVFAENYSTATGGAATVVARGDLTNNTVVRNAANQVLRFANDITVTRNTITANDALYTTAIVPSQAVLLPNINNNNIFANGEAFAIENTNQLALNAQANWWGSAQEAEIQNTLQGSIDYTGFIDVPYDDTPLSPPVVTEFTYDDNSVTIRWVPNPEADVAGYKVYTGRSPAPDFDNVIDVGMQSGFSVNRDAGESIYIAVTAYDTGLGVDSADTIVNEDQTTGVESWFSAQHVAPAKPVNSQSDGGGGGVSFLPWLPVLGYGLGRRRRIGNKS